MGVFPFPSNPDASAFDPETVGILSDAFEDAWQALHKSGTTFHLGGQEEQTSEMLARCIIELAKLGERDRRRLRDAALATLPRRISEEGAIETTHSVAVSDSKQPRKYANSASPEIVMSDADVFRLLANEAMRDSSKAVCKDDRQALEDLAYTWERAALASEKVFGSGLIASLQRH